MKINIILFLLIQLSYGFTPTIIYYKKRSRILMNKNINSNDKSNLDIFKISREQKNINRQEELFKDYVKRKTQSNLKKNINLKKCQSYSEFLTKQRALYKTRYNKEDYNRGEEPDN